MAITLKCPTCKKEILLSENPFRPFCSERCRLVDLGAWVSGEYRIPCHEDQLQENTEE